MPSAFTGRMTCQLDEPHDELAATLLSMGTGVSPELPHDELTLTVSGGMAATLLSVGTGVSSELSMAIHSPLLLLLFPPSA